MRLLADGAVLLELSNADALDLAAALAADPPAGFLDAVPGARTLLVLFDPDRFDPALLAKPLPESARAPPRTVTLQAAYDGPESSKASPPSWASRPRSWSGGTPRRSTSSRSSGSRRATRT